jgi:hypothetical protein
MILIGLVFIYLAIRYNYEHLCNRKSSVL